MFKYTFYPEYDDTEVLEEFHNDERLSDLSVSHLIAEVEARHNGIMVLMTEEEVEVEEGREGFY